MEIVVSVVILAFAVLPVIHMTTTGRKTAALTEYHILAQIRARRILEAFTSFPYQALKTVPEGEGGGLTVPLPPSEVGFPPEFQEKISRYDEMAFFEEIKPGLGVMTVKIMWTPAGGARREYVLQKIFADEGLSLTDSWPLRQKGVSFSK